MQGNAKRYIIEATDEQVIDELLVNKEVVTLIDSYDPMELLMARVQRLHTLFVEFKKSRGSWDILNYYLRGRGINQSEIDRVLGGVEEFLEKAGLRK